MPVINLKLLNKHGNAQIFDSRLPEEITAVSGNRAFKLLDKAGILKEMEQMTPWNMLTA